MMTKNEDAEEAESDDDKASNNTLIKRISDLPYKKGVVGNRLHGSKDVFISEPKERIFEFSPTVSDLIPFKTWPSTLTTIGCISYRFDMEI